MIIKLSSFLRFSLFSLGYFLKEIENIFFVFLSYFSINLQCKFTMQKHVKDDIARKLHDRPGDDG